MASQFYLDTNILISIIEGMDELTAAQRDFVAKIDAGATKAVTSELTLAECLVKPLRNQNAMAVEAYLEFLNGRPNLPVLPIARDILLDAAQQRADLRMKLPDAIHLATALAAGCDVFLTNDLRMKMPTSLVPMAWTELNSPTVSPQSHPKCRPRYRRRRSVSPLGCQ